MVDASKKHTVNLVEPKKFVVKGIVTYKYGSPVRGLTVEAYDHDPFTKSLKSLGSEITDDKGFYQIDYTANLLIKPEAESFNLLVQAKKGDKIVSEVQKPNASLDETVNLLIEPKTGHVKGTVTYKTGSSAKGLTVEAFDQDPVTKIPKFLGSKITDDKGFYQIDYLADLLIKPEAASHNLLIQAKKGDKIVATGQKSNASLDETVNLLIESKRFIVRGTVTNKDGSPAKDLIVIALDYSSAGKSLNQLGTTTTDNNGAYRIDYPADLLFKPESESPNLIFLALKYKEVVAVGQRLNALADDTVNMTLSEPSGLQVEIFSVKGAVRNKDGSMAEGITVSAFDHYPLDPGKSKLLGQTRTDNQGYYRINYKTDQLLKPKDRKPYLLVQAKEDNKLVASSQKQNAGKSEIIDLVIRK